MRTQRERRADGVISEHMQHNLESMTVQLFLFSFSVTAAISFVLLKMLTLPNGRRQRKTKKKERKMHSVGGRRRKCLMKDTRSCSHSWIQLKRGKREQVGSHRKTSMPLFGWYQCNHTVHISSNCFLPMKLALARGYRSILSFDLVYPVMSMVGTV